MIFLHIGDVENAAATKGRRLTYYSLDVTDEKAITDIYAKFIPDLRYPVKGLVSCAGLSLNGPSTDFPASGFRKMMDINVTGSFSVAQATAREFIRTNTSGSIVLVASMSGYGTNKVSSSPEFIVCLITILLY